MSGNVEQSNAVLIMTKKQGDKKRQEFQHPLAGLSPMILLSIASLKGSIISQPCYDLGINPLTIRCLQDPYPNHSTELLW